MMGKQGPVSEIVPHAIGCNLRIDEASECDCYVAEVAQLEAENAKIKRENERLHENGRKPKELAGRLYWFAAEGDHVYDMDDGGTVIIERPAMLAEESE